MKPHRRSFLLGVVMTAAACENAPTTAGPPARLAIVSGNEQQGAVGQTLERMLAVRVTDGNGEPMPGVHVTWAVTGGGGSASPVRSVSNAFGVARARWVLGHSLLAPQTLRASAGGAAAAVFGATAALGTGTTAAASSGSGQTGPVLTALPQPLVVEVRANGVPVEGLQVQWTASSGTLSDDGGGTVTDARGRASVRWTTAERAGAHMATAQVQGVGATMFTATVTPGAPAEVITQGSVFTRSRGPEYVGFRYAGESYEQHFVVVDAYRNPVAGVPMHFSASFGTASPLTQTTDASGRASASWAIPRSLDGQPRTGGETVLASLRAGVAGREISGFALADVVYFATSLFIVPDAQTVGPGTRATYDVVLEDRFGTRFPITRDYPLCSLSWSAPAAVELAPVHPSSRNSPIQATSSTPGTYAITATCRGSANPTGTATLTVR